MLIYVFFVGTAAMPWTQRLALLPLVSDFTDQVQKLLAQQQNSAGEELEECIGNFDELLVLVLPGGKVRILCTIDEHSRIE